MVRDVSAFKTYDIRGVYPGQIDEPFMVMLAKAFASHFKPEKVVIGYDARLSGPDLAAALTGGLREMGVDVMDLGLCGTETVYFATGTYKTEGGIMITASHNPKEYNGCKMVTKDAVPVGTGNGLAEIKDMVANNGPFTPVRSSGKGRYARRDVTLELVDYVAGLVREPINQSLNVIVNCGNGAAGPTIRALTERLPCRCNLMYDEPDGNFPNGVPNPLLPECRDDTSRAVVQSNADLGVAFDGDFDRCFFFDENGRFIEGYYIVGLMAQQVLKKKPGSKIIYDPRLTWNTIETVRAHGGKPVISKTGHVFIKQKMRKEKAEYGGEMSGHHYFRDFWYCDTGVLPFLLMLELLSTAGKPLSALVNDAFNRYPVSGERNFTIRESPDKVLQEMKIHFDGQGGTVSELDGLAMEFDSWRFNLRASNTEPLLRLNVEARGDFSLMERKLDKIIQLLQTYQ